MKLRKRILAAQQAADRPAHTSRRCRTEEALENLQSIASAERPPKFDREYVARQLIAKLEAGRLWSNGDLRHAVWLLWDPEHAFSNRDDLFNAVCSGVRTTDKQRVVRSAFLCYLEMFKPDARGFEDFARALGDAVDHFEWPNADFRIEKDEYSLFNPDEAPSKYADYGVRRDLPPAEILESRGISGATKSPFSEAIFSAQLKIYAQRPWSPVEGDINRLARWAFDDGSPARRRGEKKQLVFQRQKAAFAEALTLPFEHAPPLLQEMALTQLLSVLADPRTHPQDWASVSKARNIAIRWLTSESLDAFFNIVGTAALEEHWKYRQKFWLAYHETNAIEQAWVVLGPEAELHAPPALRSQGGFGRVAEAPQRSHSYIMMTIGDFTIVEASHNGACHLWAPGDRGETAPNLYQPSYNVREIRRKRREQDNRRVFFHQGSESYAWQRNISQEIRRLTGIRLQQSDYQVI